LTGTSLDDGEEERQRCQRLLATGEQREANHLLAQLLPADVYAGADRSARVGERHLSATTREQHGYVLLEGRRHLGEGVHEASLDLLVESTDHVADLTAGRLEVGELVFEELTAFVVFGELGGGEPIDRTH